MVIGRFHWGANSPDDNFTYPSPWVSFPNQTAYRKWATAMRKVRPKDNTGKRTKFEMAYVDLIHSPDSLLRAAAVERLSNARD
jgi:hypothetical protein